MSAARRTPGLALVLAATVATLAAGYLLKLPCLTSAWTDGRQYTRLCYSDVAALYASNDRERGLDDGRVPYLDARNEYPVLTGLAMGAAAWPADSYPSFFNWTAVLLVVSALATTWALYRIVGSRALFFAVAPTLAIYAFMNWDLIAVALATLATLAYLRDRDRTAGALLGLGIAAKLFPVFVLIPMLAGRLREGRRRDGAALAATAAVAWLAVNLPFAALAPENWSEFYRFNSARGADWDSVWYVLSRQLDFSWGRLELNLLAALTFVGASAAIIAAARQRDPGRPTWTFAFPVLVAFLLTSKVYSPQFSLWLLPWFALTLPNPWLFAAFGVADAAVFVTRFQFFARLAEVGPGVPFEAFEVALVIRAVVLVACVVAWVRRMAPEPEPVPQPALEAA